MCVYMCVLSVCNIHTCSTILHIHRTCTVLKVRYGDPMSCSSCGSSFGCAMWTACFGSFVWYLALIAGGIRNIKIGKYESFTRISGLTVWLGWLWNRSTPTSGARVEWNHMIIWFSVFKAWSRLENIWRGISPLECCPQLSLWCLATRRCLTMALFEEMEVSGDEDCPEV